MAPRRLSLHASALNEAEYDFYTHSLLELALPDSDVNTAQEGQDLKDVTVGVREARAWFRGRFPTIPVSDVDAALKLFYPSLKPTDLLSSGQFFAALRLIIHIQEGSPVDRDMAFIQATPPGSSSSSKPPPVSPSKPPEGQSSYPSSQLSEPYTPTLPPKRVLRDTPTLSRSQTQVYPGSRLPPSIRSPTNPFISSSITSSTPPLPPRKAAPPPPPPQRSLSSFGTLPLKTGTKTLTVPAHVTTPLMQQSLQASKTGHAMKNAERMLEKERVMQVLKSSSSNANPSSASTSQFGTMGRSTSPVKIPTYPSSSSRSTSSSERYRDRDHKPAGPDKDLRAPPLPMRKRADQLSFSPPLSTSSFEQVASAHLPSFGGSSVLNKQPPPPPPPKQKQPPPVKPKPDFPFVPPRNNPIHATKSRSPSPKRSPQRPHLFASTGDSPSQPPPTHPDRRRPSNSTTSSAHVTDSLNSSSPGLSFRSPTHLRTHSIGGSSPRAASDSFEAVYGTDLSSPFSSSTEGDRELPSTPSRMTRSKSLHASPRSGDSFSSHTYGHGAKPPMAPSASPFTSANTGGKKRPESIGFLPSRHLSLLARRTRGSDEDASVGDGHVARTLEKLTRARYKAEAGISRRGFLSGEGVGTEEGRAGLVRSSRNIHDRDEEDEDNTEGGDSTSDDEDSIRRVGEQGYDGRFSSGRSINGKTGKDGDVVPVNGREIERDSMKWPAQPGEGWAPL